MIPYINNKSTNFQTENLHFGKLVELDLNSSFAFVIGHNLADLNSDQIKIECAFAGLT